MEPKWNVKATIKSDRIPTASVLMEPKWNVKDYSNIATLRLERINGTKVECKDCKAAF